jgi:predicted ArsR family transcriptional regulator
VSGSDGLSASAREFLQALRSGPLDVQQLAADLAVIPVAVTAELEGLIEAGLVHAVTVDSGRQAWGLTIRGRTHIAMDGKP